jgi:hypothetical protein
MIDVPPQSGHDLTAFPIFGKSSSSAAVAQNQSANTGPFVYFLPTDQICGDPSSQHAPSQTPMVQIVQPAGVGRYIGIPKPTPAYLTAADCGPNILLATTFINRGHIGNFI